MEEGTVSGTYMFRGIEYVVTMILGPGSLVVEVEDRLTADQWRGTFDSAYIEDLTHKTGNYKQFQIFVSMLESALTQSSDSVALDLLTYSDLESLRNRKAGIGSKNVPAARPATLNSKRYLILTYTVEFDRIHYPLPLPYMGKPDPRSLQETIRQLRGEVKTLKHTNHRDYKSKELGKLQRDFDQLLQEKEDIEAEFLAFRREVEHTTKGNAAKEVRILKNVIKNLEEELVEEKARNQKASMKRNQECRKLMDEVDELRASERNLRVRVKSLTNELSMYKSRRAPNTSVASSRHSTRSHRSTQDISNTSLGSARSRENSRLSYKSNRSTSRDRTHPRRSNSADRLNDRFKVRDRSSSRERLSSGVYMRDRAGSFDRARSSSRERISRNNSRERPTNTRDRLRSRTPSPRGFPKFDPTAFVKEKERKQKEAELKKKRQTRGKMNGSLEKKSRPSPLSERNRGRNRSSSFGSLHSGRASSVESLTDLGMMSDSSQTQRRRKGSRTDVWSSSDVSYSRESKRTQNGKILASTPEGSRRKSRINQGKENSSDGLDSDFYDRSEEISEIDARLNRLQRFMKTTMA